MSAIETTLKEYLDYLEIEKNRSPRTRSSYERCLRRFVAEENITSPKEITEERIRDFRLRLSREGKLKKSTQAYFIIAIRNFLKYLVKRGTETVSPDRIELPKVPERQIRPLEYSDLVANALSMGIYLLFYPYSFLRLVGGLRLSYGCRRR